MIISHRIPHVKPYESILSCVQTIQGTLYFTAKVLTTSPIWAWALTTGSQKKLKIIFDILTSLKISNKNHIRSSKRSNSSKSKQDYSNNTKQNLTLPKRNSLPMKIGLLKRKGSTSLCHHCSVALAVGLPPGDSKWPNVIPKRWIGHEKTTFDSIVLVTFSPNGPQKGHLDFLKGHKSPSQNQQTCPTLESRHRGA